MWNRITLRVRIYLILAALMAITLGGGLVMVGDTYRIEAIFNAIIHQDLAAYQAAEAMETAMVNQKGFVSYYFLDGDPDWLRQLGEYRQLFKERLNQAKLIAENDQQKDAVHRIESEYAMYILEKDRVIEYYKAGERQTGSKLHQEVRNRFFKILQLCEAYKNLHADRIRQAGQQSYLQAQKLRIVAGSAVVIGFLLAALLAFVLVHHILAPVHRLTLTAERKSGSVPSKNEIKALSRSVHGLIEDIDHTHSELEKSREHLLQVGKMALVGRLAAGMAHSIRNPFTSVKMRLFSLGRAANLSETQQDDLKVISEEIRHIDAIVQNFLEFSRPPRLKMQQISPSAVVDSTIQLLEHRLGSYDVDIQIVRDYPLPDIPADPEQLKEVLVNLVVNACEAMKKGGSIVIQEEESAGPSQTRWAVVRVSDNGPGIPEPLKDKIFQPFFTTKEEGTGLGLSIAARIIEEHGGRLEASSTKGPGASFIITLPIKEPSFEHHPDHRR